jgi:hypothetical protein
MFPQQTFLKVCPTPQLRTMLIRRYARKGWQRFVTFKDVSGWGVHAAVSHYGDDFIPNYTSNPTEV